MKNKNNISLLKVFLKKESVHWKRLFEMNSKFSWLGKFTGYVICSILITLFHYTFVIAHMTFEIFLYLFFRDQFRLNMKKLYNC